MIGFVLSTALLFLHVVVLLVRVGRAVGIGVIVIILLVTAVAFARFEFLIVVDNDAEDVCFRKGKGVEGALDIANIGNLVTANDYRTVGNGCKRQRVGKKEYGRRVDDDVIVTLTQLVQQALHFFTFQQFVGLGGMGTASDEGKETANYKKEKASVKMISTRLSSRKPCACLLFPFLHSVVLLYADECKNEKYSYLFRSLTACRETPTRCELGKPTSFLLTFCDLSIILKKGK